MTDYPYDFGNGYKVQMVFANRTENGVYGDICDFRSEVEREHPGAEIMTGYCVIDEKLGLIPEGCNSWNDSISAAIQDYEDHIVPMIEREETFDMNCPVYDTEDNFLYEAFFACKSGWLQDYFGADNRCQLEAIWDIGNSREDSENFVDALEDAHSSGIQIQALVRDNVKVEWETIGEGLHGDYDPADPEDIELLRFYVSVLRNGVWEEKEDASYCTQLPTSATAAEQLAGLEILLTKFHDALSADIDVSVKKLGEKMSWIDPSSVSKHMRSLNPVISIRPEATKHSATGNLIKAMAEYGHESCWNDSEIIDALVDCGITYDDFETCGYRDFVKNYFEDEKRDKLPIDSQIQSASMRSAGSPSTVRTKTHKDERER